MAAASKETPLMAPLIYEEFYSSIQMEEVVKVRFKALTMKHEGNLQFIKYKNENNQICVNQSNKKEFK